MRSTDWAALGLVLLLGCVIHGWIASYALTVTTFTDSMDYLFIADFYRSAIYGLDPGLGADVYRMTHYPPLFPLILGLAGAGTAHQLLASLVSNLIALAAVVAVWVWVRSEFRSTPAATFAASGLLVFPYHFLINLSPVSEPLGMLFMATAFFLVSAPKANRSRLLVAGLVIGLAPLARTALLPLSIAFLIWLYIRRPLPIRQLILPALAAWAPFLLWAAYRKATGSILYSDYVSGEQFSQAAIQWPQALWEQPARLFDAFVRGWGVSADPLLVILTALISVLCVFGCMLRISRNQLDGWFLAGYLAMIMIWPFPAELTRFLVVVYPCILLCCLSAAQQMDYHRPAFLRSLNRPFSAMLMLCVFAAGLPAALRYAHRASLDVDAELLGDKREPGYFLAGSDDDAMIAIETYARGRILLGEAGHHMPANACMYALPHQLGMLYSTRRVLPYPPDLTGDIAAEARLRDCEYYFLGAWSSLQLKVPPLYPMSVIEDWTEPVLISEIVVGKKSFVAAALVKRHSLPQLPATENPDADR